MKETKQTIASNNYTSKHRERKQTQNEIAQIGRAITMTKPRNINTKQRSRKLSEQRLRKQTKETQTNQRSRQLKIKHMLVGEICLSTFFHRCSLRCCGSCRLLFMLFSEFQICLLWQLLWEALGGLGRLWEALEGFEMLCDVQGLMCKA